jgi:hypothetical protein
MPIREDLVASAVNFLHDPSSAASPIENRIAFLKAKNLTEEEVRAAIARAGAGSGTSPQHSAPPAATTQQEQAIYGQYAGQYSPYPWQPMPPEVPRRDWRDWFIMATVVGGIGYGLYALGKVRIDGYHISKSPGLRKRNSGIFIPWLRRPHRNGFSRIRNPLTSNLRRHLPWSISS